MIIMTNILINKYIMSIFFIIIIINIFYILCFKQADKVMNSDKNQMVSR